MPASPAVPGLLLDVHSSVSKLGENRLDSLLYLGQSYLVKECANALLNEF